VKAVVLNRVLVVLGFIGIYIAGLLSLEKMLNIELPCGPSGGCATVSSHPSAFWLGLPVAYFGLFGYLVLTLIAVLRAIQPADEMKPLVTLGYIISAIGAALSLYLQYTALFVIKAVCPFCLASAITMILTLIFHALLAQAVRTSEAAPAAAGAAPGESPYARPEEQVVENPSRRSKLDVVLPIALALAVPTILFAQASSMKQANGTTNLTEEKKQVPLIPDRPNQYGAANAPITIVEWADLCCLSCQRNAPKIKEFINQHPGRIRVIFRHFPLPMHKQASTAAAMAEYAADKGKFWDFAMAVMAPEKEPQSVDELLAAANTAGLNIEDMLKRMENEKDPIYERIKRDKEAAHQLGISSTPTFLVMAPNMETKVARANAVFEMLSSPEYRKILEGK
jgi:protein-disulfide isomerase